MSLTKLLVANRGEIAIRIMRAARDLGIATVAVAGDDDLGSLHTRIADESIILPGRGPVAYLDIDVIVGAAVDGGCDGLHPGYGFLAEHAVLADRCERAGVTFVGPTSAQLARFGDKLAARALAEEVGVPLLPGTTGETSIEEAERFLADNGPMMIKAVAGGGGRGMRSVRPGDDIVSAYERSRSEAGAAFGNSAVYVEALIERARHIEVQIVGDGSSVAHIGERECTLQRQNQKLVEVAPSPTLGVEAREALTAAAVRMAAKVGYRSLGTWEFLVDGDDDTSIAFMETNARLQVEHTVTEQVTGLDLVQSQLRLAGGATLADLGLTQDRIPEPRGHAVQVRVNTETMTPEGVARPSGGTLVAFEAPTGPGIRTDTYGYVGYTTNPSFDSLLAKVIGHATSADYGDALQRTRRALGEFRVEGVATNIGFLQALLDRAEVAANDVTTSFVTDHAPELVQSAVAFEQRYFAASPAGDERPAFAGARVDPDDPLAVLSHGAIDGPAAADVGPPPPPAPVVPVSSALVGRGHSPGVEGSVAVEAPLQGTVVAISVKEGDPVAEGQQVLVMEAMKMEHEIRALADGIVRQLAVSVGDTVFEGHPLLFVEHADVDIEAERATVGIDLDLIRPDLQEMYDRRAYGLDENRPEAVAKRHGRGHRTARENVAQLVDDGTFVEYGRLMLAAQRRRREFQDLLENTSGDGMVAGIGSVNGDLFDADTAQTMVMSYDYMVLAGTQGGQNHRKKDRMFELAERNRLPVVLYAEGGGGRPGDTDGIGGSGLDCWAFTFFAELSGLVPVVGITNGRCFAGNAVLLGCCDVIIATEGSNIGIGGPAMVEGGGLGIFKPEEIGPTDVQVPNGVIDILVRDEEEATDVAKQYLSYFQGPIADWEAHDQRILRHLVPENRKRVYDMRDVIEQLADVDSVLELRPSWGPGAITCLARIEGRPIGIVANNPHHLAGAIDATAGDKGARFIQLCDAHDISLLFLCDTPGIMVGPQAEYEATVRHAARMFVTAASIDVPFMTIVTRKGYGLGAQAMAGGSFKATNFTVAWPTGEFGGMGLEGFVKLGYRKELEAIEDPAERVAVYEERVARLYDIGKAVNTGSYFEVDDVIDPAESREWIMMALRSAPKSGPRTGKKRPMVDTW
ncbi:MAG: carbamoyl-phosphate synthase large subunit [Acidimicrobiia bacterium]|nr:carbamoyl-phosphate synthase large subunit [Acidimicrobiia bacterium]